MAESNCFAAATRRVISDFCASLVPPCTTNAVWTGPQQVHNTITSAQDLIRSRSRRRSVMNSIEQDGCVASLIRFSVKRQASLSNKVTARSKVTVSTEAMPETIAGWEKHFKVARWVLQHNPKRTERVWHKPTARLHYCVCNLRFSFALGRCGCGPLQTTKAQP